MGDWVTALAYDAALNEAVAKCDGTVSRCARSHTLPPVVAIRQGRMYRLVHVFLTVLLLGHGVTGEPSVDPVAAAAAGGGKATVSFERSSIPATFRDQVRLFVICNPATRPEFSVAVSGAAIPSSLTVDGLTAGVNYTFAVYYIVNPDDPSPATGDTSSYTSPPVTIEGEVPGAPTIQHVAPTDSPYPDPPHGWAQFFLMTVDERGRSVTSLLASVDVVDRLGRPADAAAAAAVTASITTMFNVSGLELNCSEAVSYCAFSIGPFPRDERFRLTVNATNSEGVGPASNDVPFRIFDFDRGSEACSPGGAVSNGGTSVVFCNTFADRSAGQSCECADTPDRDDCSGALTCTHAWKCCLEECAVCTDCSAATGGNCTALPRGASDNGRCVGYTCDGHGACLTSCNSSSDCVQEDNGRKFFCHEGECKEQVDFGQPCPTADACFDDAPAFGGDYYFTAFCSEQGYCCCSPCPGGICDPSTNFTCLKALGTDCSDSSECGSGICDTTCCAAVCEGPCRTCDDTGGCIDTLAPTGGTCGGFMCDGAGSCLTECASNSECTPLSYCDTNSTCQPKKAAGAVCSAGSQCLSGFCPDGFCCQTACGLPCKSCGDTGDCRHALPFFNQGQVCGNYTCSVNASDICFTTCNENAPTDALSGCDAARGFACVRGKCLLPDPSCEDEEMNGDETGVDCGGSCAECPECFRSADCTAGRLCADGACLFVSANPIDPCTNGILDANEEDIDCGGNCTACPACRSNENCPSGFYCSFEGRCEQAQNAISGGDTTETTNKAIVTAEAERTSRTISILGLFIVVVAYLLMLLFKAATNPHPTNPVSFGKKLLEVHEVTGICFANTEDPYDAFARMLSILLIFDVQLLVSLWSAAVFRSTEDLSSSFGSLYIYQMIVSVVVGVALTQAAGVGLVQVAVSKSGKIGNLPLSLLVKMVAMVWTICLSSLCLYLAASAERPLTDVYVSSLVAVLINFLVFRPVDIALRYYVLREKELWSPKEATSVEEVEMKDGADSESSLLSEPVALPPAETQSSIADRGCGEVDDADVVIKPLPSTGSPRAAGGSGSGNV